MFEQVSKSKYKHLERGVKEANHIRANQPSLNKDGGRHRLSRVYDPVLTSSNKGNRGHYVRTTRHHKSADESNSRVTENSR